MKYSFLYILLLITFISCKKEAFLSEAVQSAIDYNGDRNIVGEHSGNITWSKGYRSRDMMQHYSEVETNVKGSIFVKYVGKDSVEVSFDNPPDFRYKVYVLRMTSKIVDNTDSYIAYYFLGTASSPIYYFSNSSLSIKSYKDKKEIDFEGVVTFEGLNTLLVDIEFIKFINY